MKWSDVEKVVPNMVDQPLSIRNLSLLSEIYWNFTNFSFHVNAGPNLSSYKSRVNLNISFNYSIIPVLSNITSINVEDYLGLKRNKSSIVVCLTLFYATIFVTGVMGNLFTCIVVVKNFYMKTVTNYYLVSLALTDLLTLTFGK